MLHTPGIRPMDLEGVKKLLSESDIQSILHIVKKFKPIAKKKGWHLQLSAINKCGEASKEFVKYLTKNGVPDESINIVYYGFIPPGGVPTERYPIKIDDESYYHYVVRVGDGLIIDWTARQFDSTAPFPSIWLDDQSEFPGVNRAQV